MLLECTRIIKYNNIESIHVCATDLAHKELDTHIALWFCLCSAIIMIGLYTAIRYIYIYIAKGDY